MAKSKEKILACKLRKNGLSINEICRKLKVSKGSVSLWCHNIKLTKEQTEKLHKNMVTGSYAGRLKGTLMQKTKKERAIKFYEESGKKDLINIKKRELLIAGVALYWGEGSKKSSPARFYNSDPIAIKFIMRWFREILQVEDYRFQIRVSINEIHKDRLKEVCRYWSKITNIPVNQFKNVTLLKIKNKKVYDNFSKYYGTLCVGVSKSTNLYYQIKGLIKALGEAG